MKNLYATLICRSGYVCAAAAAQTLSVLRFVLLSYFLKKMTKASFLVGAYDVEEWCCGGRGARD